MCACLFVGWLVGWFVRWFATVCCGLWRSTSLIVMTFDSLACTDAQHHRNKTMLRLRGEGQSSRSEPLC